MIESSSLRYLALDLNLILEEGKVLQHFVLQNHHPMNSCQLSVSTFISSSLQYEAGVLNFFKQFIIIDIIIKCCIYTIHVFVYEIYKTYI